MDIPNASEALQQATYSISHWVSTWRIAFESTKSQPLQIDHNRPPWGKPAIRFNGFIPEADQIRLLGVVFDRHLRFTAHICSAALRANSRLHLLQKCAPLLFSHGRATVYKAFVRPPPLVWMGASATTPGLLDTVQRRACNSVTRYLTLTTSQFTPMHLHDSFLGLAFSSPCLRVTSSHLYAHFSSIYSCELKKKKVSYSQQLSADLLHW